MTSEVTVANRVVVAGTVLDSNGQPVAGVEVSVSERRLRSEVPLGEYVTGVDGRYRLDYDASPGAVGLTVRAMVDGRPAAEVVHRAGAQTEMTIDLELPPDQRTEYARVLAAVSPLLDDAPLGNLSAADVSHLAGATPYSEQQIARLVAATGAADKTALSAEMFYAAASQGLSQDPIQLGQRSPSEIEAAITTAAETGVTGFGSNARSFAEAVRAAHIATVVDPGSWTSPLGDLFVAAVPDRSERERIYSAYLDRPVDWDGDWERLAAADTAASVMDRLRLAWQLHELTDRNVALVRELLGEFDSGRFQHPHELVRLNGNWAELVERSGGAPVPVGAKADAALTDPVARYTTTLRKRLIAAYPTAHVAHELSARPEHADRPAAGFLADNPEFDIVATPVNSATVPDRDARHELGEIQRTFKITGDFDVMQALRDNGFTSAHAVAGLGRDMFARIVSDTVGADEAQRIHARATQVQATAANLLADLRTAGHFDVPWLPSMSDPAAGPSTHQIPDWEELFGPADYGTFAPCRSVHGQPAYLVDLLYYLRRLGGGSDQDEGLVAKALYGRRNDVAYTRRDDLRDVELSDANTDLELPYVDLVNELLESIVAPDTAIAPARRQSSGDATTLRIQPQHVNPGAYEKLRAAVYPWDLPFDLYREQTDAHLVRAGATRVALLETLGAAPDSPNLLGDERLGLNTVAAQIIAGEQLTPGRSLAEFWGLPAAADPIRELTTVREVLVAGSLRYTDLTRLLDTRFINPAGAVRVTQNSDSPYDTTTMTLAGFDAGVLDRMHRFVRLQRALGWSAQDLDRAVGGGNNHGRLDRTTLRGIDAVRRLAARLDLSIEQVLTFYNVIETHSYPGDSEPSLYDRLFLDPAVVAAEPGVAHPFALRPDRTELNVVGSITTPTVTAALLGVLQITDEDLAALITGPRSVVPDHVLNLANLSMLVRVVTLANALSLAIPDLLRLIELYGDGGPFPSLAAIASGPDNEVAGGAPILSIVGDTLPAFARDVEAEVAGGAPVGPPSGIELAPLPPTDAQAVSTERFLDAVQAIQNAGFEVADLDVVLTDIAPAFGGVTPDGSALAATLTTLRTALQAVYRQTGQTTDERGESTRRHLTVLGWDPGLAQDATATLLGTLTYKVDLTTLPDSVVIASDIPVRHNPDEGTLLCAGPMTTEQYDRLRQQARTEADYQAAVRSLYDAPRTFVAKRMKALRIPVYSTPLTQLPVDYQTPTALLGKVYFDVSDHTLKSRGYLSDTDVVALKAAAHQDATFVAAVDGLVKNQEAPVTSDNVFLTEQDAAAFFDTGAVGPARRFERVLGILNPVVRRVLSEITVKQQLGQAAGLDSAAADLLLGTWLRSSGSAVLQNFLLPEFVGSDPAVPIGRPGFARQLTSLALIHRVSLVLTRLNVRAPEIPFLFGYAATSGWLDFNSLPTTSVSGASPLFGDFIRLLDLIRVRGSIPGGFRSLSETFVAARRGGATATEVITVLAAATGWGHDDVTRLSDVLGIVVPERFTDTGNLLALIAAVRLLRRLGVTADRVLPWRRAPLGPDAAQAAWKAAKAKHALEDWPVVAAPMQDRIRERQRAALVSYLVANPLRSRDNTPEWSDANGLHDFLLLDVEMGATQLTTRMAQAIYSVQLFVQRCLLNLEPAVRTSDSALWQQWDWMQQYRVWEANQKVFLYPENYFEPDLRVDKTPFFAELTNEIMQKEVTDDNVGDSVRHYLDKLDGVARLHPCGTYQSYDVPANRTIHVFARSESTPRTYYYRTWIDRMRWTAWQKMDLDITSNTLTPVIWNDQLYVFWPTFTPDSDPAPVKSLPDPNKGDTALKPVEKYLKINLNWSKLGKDGWHAKKIAEPTIETRLKYLLNPTWTIYNFDQSQSSPYWFSAYFANPPSTDLTIGVMYNAMIEISGAGGTSKGVPLASFTLTARRGEVDATDLVAKTAMRLPDGSPDPVELAELERMLVHGPSGTDTVDNEFVKLNGPSAPFSMDYYARTGSTDPTVFLGSVAPPYRVLSVFEPGDNWDWLYMFLSDGSRSYLLDFWPRAVPSKVQVTNFFHPYVERMLAALERGGLDAVFSRDIQLRTGTGTGEFRFEDYYQPNSAVIGDPYPDEDVDFSESGAYSQYNWEFFFHAPLLAAERLSTNQKFADAQRWFHRVFDPTDRSNASSPQRYWLTRPFFETSTDPNKPGNYFEQRIEEVLRRLASGNTAEQEKIEQWLSHPFQPDVVARLRTTAYQKSVVMKYLDNLIAWGDQLFRQGTGESVNKATQLYILAAELLGRRPEEVFDPTPTVAQTFRTIAPTTGSPANPIVRAEHLIGAGIDVPQRSSITVGVGMAWLNYFRVPRNEKLLAYWDIVDDRLSKIRTGRTIDGIARKLPSFGAVIDPNLLVRAAAAGLDLSVALDDISAPMPHYRFAPLVAKAKELANEVKSFGAAFLAALEKRDIEALSRLRSSHEIAVADAVRSVKQQQVTEAEYTLQTAQQAQVLAQGRLNYYSSREFMNGFEIAHTAMAGAALVMQTVAGGIHMAETVTAHVPDAKIGFPTTVGATYGGSNISRSLEALGTALDLLAGVLNGGAGLAATIGGYQRRQEEWDFQANQARNEITQAAAQIAAATARKEIADTELTNHDLQIANAKEADRFLYSKFTNQELYDWMIGQLATTYFQAYQLAYDIAKRAERAYRHELGVEDSNFVNFGYWDSLHKGLLAGERLTADLNRMDAAYLDANAREFELTKRISLAQLDARAVLRLKETGTCYVSLPEALFDLDTPGHYFRRIKSFAITVPCVAGPYAGVNLTATLVGSSVRVDSRLTSDSKYPRLKGTDTRFRDYTGPVESIVTSTGLEDSGLFETNLRDERFLPFEGMGAISQWQLSLPGEFRQFDYESITDVVLHLRYTAREGGSALGDAAVRSMKEALDLWVRGGGGKGLVRMFSARREFSDQWQQFLATPARGTAKATFVLSKSRFPTLFRDRQFTTSNPELVLVLSHDLIPDGTKRYLDCYPGDGAKLRTTLTVGRSTPATDLMPDPTLGGLPRATYSDIKSIEVQDTGQNWVITASIADLDPHLLTSDGRLNPDAVLDLLLVCPFTLKDRN